MKSQQTDLSWSAVAERRRLRVSVAPCLSGDSPLSIFGFRTYATLVLGLVSAVAILLLLCGPAGAGEPIAESGIPTVGIDFFYEAGCPDCIRIRAHILPELNERLEGFYVLREYDIGITSNVTRLIAYQEKLGIKKNEPVLMVVDYRHVFNGYDAIETGLFCRVEQCVTERLEPGWQPPAGIQPAVDGKTLKRRIGGFTLPMVLTAGLIDGVNPCAFSALVFFMSLLAVSSVRGRAVLLVGTGFCIAAFVTYTALGLGLLRILHLLPGHGVLRSVVDAVFMAALAGLSFLSFRDAYRYAVTGDAARVSLQLSKGMKKRVHRLMHTGMGFGGLLLGGLFVGATVTAIESICTGQVYIPTLILVSRSAGGAASRARLLLLAYNAMFVVPLVAVFLLTCLGLKVKTLVAWSKREVIIGKILLGLFFLAAAVFTSRLL